MVKKLMTYDEMLKDALNVEKPYDLPNGWIWVKLGITIDLHRGVTYKKNQVLEKNTENSCLIIRGGNIINGDFVFEDNVYIPKSLIKELQFIKKNDIVIVSSTGSNKVIGKAAIAKRDYADVSFGAFTLLIRPCELINKNYIGMFFLGDMYRETIKKNVSGININNIRREHITEQSFPVPPLPEQQRLVEKIESIFEKLDRAKELVQEALESFENRRSAILHKAFTGELTEKWREKNGVSWESWEEKTFKDIVKIQTNLVDPKDYLDFPHIAPDNIEKRTGKLLEYNTIKQDGVKSSKHRFYKGQIIYSKIRPYLSKVAIVDFDGLCSADMYPIDWDYNNKYLYYHMLSDTFLDKASNAGSRSVLPKINQKELGRITLPVPIKDEQEIIADVLDSLLEKEDRAKELINIIDDIEIMKKTILAKAFRGELDTGNPDDEPAIKLVERIVRERCEANIKEQMFIPVANITKITESIEAYQNNIEEQIFIPTKINDSIESIRLIENSRIERIQIMKNIYELLLEYKGSTSPQKLYKASGLSIDEFYCELKKYVNQGKISEVKEPDGTRKLVANYEN